MIRMTSKQSGDLIQLTVSGHAGSGPFGHDLVCAAVSALTQSLEINVEGAESLARAGLSVVLMPYTKTNRALYKAYLNSMSKLADQYPESVQIDSVVTDWQR